MRDGQALADVEAAQAVAVRQGVDVLQKPRTRPGEIQGRICDPLKSSRLQLFSQICSANGTDLIDLV